MSSQKKVDGKICDYKPMLNQKMFNAEVEEFIRYMVAGDEFRKFVQEKLEEKVDVSALETTETGTRVETETDTDVGSPGYWG